MAFIKKGLLGPHRRLPAPYRPGAAKKAQAAIERAFDKWAKTGERPPGMWGGDTGGRDFPGARHLPITPPGFKRPHMPMPQGPPQITGFPGMGDMQPPPAWQTQQPGFYESDQMGQGPGPDGAPDPRWEGTLNPAGLEALGGMQGPSHPFDSGMVDQLMGFQKPPQHAFNPGMFPGVGGMRRPPRQIPPNFMDLVRQFAGQRSAPQGRFGMF